MKRKSSLNSQPDFQQDFILDNGLGLSNVAASEFVKQMLSYLWTTGSLSAKLNYHIDPKPKISLEIYTLESSGKSKPFKVRKSNSFKSVETSEPGMPVSKWDALNASPSLTPSSTIRGEI